MLQDMIHVFRQVMNGNNRVLTYIFFINKLDEI
jgi:hypothetical protein